MYYRNNNYYDFYKIVEGDTLYKISKKYNVNPNLLASINGLNINDYIYPNQVIMVPSLDYSYYVTASGDTLKSVSDKLNINEEELLKYNKEIYLLDGQMIIKKK